MSGVVRFSLNRIVPVMRSNVIQKASVISGPPRNPMPFKNKVVIGGTMCAIIIAPMFWIMANVKNYKKGPGEE